ADVGAGTGLFTLDFARAVGPTGAVYAVDLMPTFLEHIAAKAAKAGLKNVTTVAATASSCNLPAGSVDLAYMSDAYHHIENPPAYLASLRRALAPAGELVIIDFKRIPGESSAWLLDHVRAGKEEVIGELEDAGFEVVADLPILEENYFLRLRLRADAAP
ncbi:MAG: class I SAM-dependent methyltransferase, partial [Myxococcales bacterium]|nr:class I SAM-dependent methyltransferase [Myxococcales bacterium]